MEVWDIIKMIEQDGCFLVRQKKRNKQYKHPVKKGLVTIIAHKQLDELASGTLNSILKEAQIRK